MTAIRSRRRGAALVLVALVTALQVLLPGTASADACGPPTPEWPGDSLVGSVDPPSLGKGAPTSAYDEYAYAGLVWNTYQTGLTCEDAKPDAFIDTYFGNFLFKGAKLLVAITNGLHWMQESSGHAGAENWGPLAPLDDAVVTLTAELYNNVFTAWVGVALAIAAVVILWWTLKGNLAKVGTRTLYVLASLTFAAMTYLLPLYYAGLIDGLLNEGVGTVQSQIIKLGPQQYKDLPDYQVLPQMLHDSVVYQPWLQGEFGAANSPEATEYGMRLLDAQACSKEQLAAAQNEHKPCPIEAKQNSFRDIAEKLKGTPAYGKFTGASSNRVGAGAASLGAAVCYSLFQLLCLFALFVAKVLIRVLILCGPIIGVVGIVHPPVLHRVVNAIGTALGIGIVLSVVSAVHATVLDWILAPDTTNPVGDLGKLLLAGLITLVLWMGIKPMRKFRTMLESSLKLAGMETMPWEQIMQRRMFRRMYRQQGRHNRNEERAHQDIYNNLNTLNVVTGLRPEVDEEPVYATAERPMRARAERLFARTTMPPGRSGALPGDPGGNPPESPSGSPSRGGSPEPGGSGGGSGAYADGPTAYSGPGAHRPALPVGDEPDAADHATPRQDEVDDRPASPRAGEPRIVRPSEHWGRRTDNDDTGGPRVAPSYDDQRGRRVYKVYRPSSGRIEPDNGRSHQRPEAEE